MSDFALAVNRVAGELFEEREDLLENAALVALHGLEEHLATLSERDALAQPAFELAVIDAAPLGASPLGSSE